ncbi:hypothetical protein [Rariglobus hedericola]|uniref:Uncharacterized protein n=1 Tax=Rariglobus hedericola TaxID=2597822 RepID=A0A556QRI4_9BACT|nr:hypothetical protein [Rariglobus hedericola]TSJ79254.1 hypothetical protein FPL22_08165 [Rariglobus hedericola]
MSKANSTTKKATGVRGTNSRHEGTILATGQLYYFMAAGLVLAALTGVIVKPWHGAFTWPHTLWAAGVFAGLGALYAVVGYGFRTLAPWSRYAVGALALICIASMITRPEGQPALIVSIALIKIFALPVGLLITLYGVYLAYCPQGKQILSKNYQQVVADTPKVKFGFSKIFLVVAILLASVQAVRVLMIFINRAT